MYSRHLLFVVLCTVVVFFLVLCISPRSSMSRSIKMGSCVQPEAHLVPESPAFPIHMSSTKEGFTVGFEKRHQPRVPGNPYPQVVQSAIQVPPPYPLSANESVGIDCRHGKCVYTETKEHYTDYKMLGLREPRDVWVRDIPNYKREILSGPMNIISYRELRK